MIVRLLAAAIAALIFCLVSHSQPAAASDCKIHRPRIVNGYGVHHGQAVIVDSHHAGYNAERIVVLPVKTNDYYWTVQDYYRESLFADAVATRTALLLRGGEPPAKDGKARPERPDPPATGRTPPDATGTPPPKAGTPGKAVLNVPAEVRAAVEKVVAAKCLKCHSGSVTKAGLDLSNLDNLTREQAYVMFEEVESGRMPEKDEPLSNDDVGLFRKFSRGFQRAVASK